MRAGQIWPDGGNDNDGALGAVQAVTGHGLGPAAESVSTAQQGSLACKFQVVLRMLARTGMHGGFRDLRFPHLLPGLRGGQQFMRSPGGVGGGPSPRFSRGAVFKTGCKDL
jgi:hypothetical protein